MFDDGHKYCFGCHYYERAAHSVTQAHATQPAREYNPKAYPWDVDNYIPVKPMQWLLSCNISPEKQRKYGIQYSPTQELCCWEIANPEGKIIGWQGRCFGETAKTKYISHGKIHEDICVLGKKEGHFVVLCEDYLSAINLAELGSAVPLFGCTCHLNALQALSKRFKEVVVWLDPDKLDNARKIALNANKLGLASRVMYTPKDPKYYTKEQLASFLEVVA